MLSGQSVSTTVGAWMLVPPNSPNLVMLRGNMGVQQNAIAEAEGFAVTL